mgnify:CR=1 FL=1
MPAWIRGSYLIRDPAKHVFELRAWRGDAPVSVQRLDKSAFMVPAGEGALCIRYRVHASDNSVRKAFLDANRGFFNGSSLFYAPVSIADAAFEIRLQKPSDPSCSEWKVATAMTAVETDAAGFGRYVASDFEELLDHPFELGRFVRRGFEVDGIAHDLVLAGRVDADVDAHRVTADLGRICSAQRQMFGGEPELDQYLFLTNVVNAGYGGLEHRASCALICCRTDFPRLGESGTSTEYRNFLGLCSHEYFHLWNVKRITAENFKKSDLSREAYTEDLWHYEGVTSYYDDLFLLRAQCVDAAGYLDLLAQTATRLQRTPARLRQTLAEASFETWIKFYQPDDNSLNANTNYYAKGALVALCLDLELRLNSDVTLDTVMQSMWKTYGRQGQGVPEGGFAAMAERVSGLNLQAFFEKTLRSTQELPLVDLLSRFGVTAELRACTSPIDNGGRTLASMKSCWAGLRLKPGSTTVSHVLDDGPAQAAGLSVDDELVALEGLRLTPQQWHKQMERQAAGQALQLHYFRDEALQLTSLCLQEAPLDTWTMTLADIENESVGQRRRQWLGV